MKEIKNKVINTLYGKNYMEYIMAFNRMFP